MGVGGKVTIQTENKTGKEATVADESWKWFCREHRRKRWESMRVEIQMSK